MAKRSKVLPPTLQRCYRITRRSSFDRAANEAMENFEFKMWYLEAILVHFDWTKEMTEDYPLVIVNLKMWQIG